MIKSLTRLNAKVCGHTRANEKVPTAPCDCKYGPSTADNPQEHTGCPELRQLLKTLRHLSDAEYDRAQRASGFVTDEGFFG
jgi:hypothetical protein